MKGWSFGVEQLLAWSVLLIVLVMIASGRFRMEIAALGGLLILGIAGVAPPNIIFSGFGHPALATIIAVFFVSQGIINSGLLRGLGQLLAGKTQSLRGQIISTAGVGSLMSAFMNNVGAVGLMLPTAVRMAKRSGCSPGTFGLPLAMASILGGTVTLIGSAPNIIIASYMFSSTGQSFKMFDYAPHGLAMLATALLLWFLCKTCGIDPGAGCADEEEEAKQVKTADKPSLNTGDQDLNETIHFAPFATRERQVTFFAILLAVLLVSFGLLHPAFGFGGATLLLILFGVLKPPAAYDSVDLKIVFFLGAMLGIGQTLEHSGSLEILSTFLGHYTAGLAPFWLILILFFVASALSNAINNSASAVFMAPLAVGLAAGNSLQTAAALMAVAAGSNLTLILPTHQAVLMVLSKAPFPVRSLMRFGLILTLCCGLAAAAVINFFWQ
ncbi:MAG: SLC13 family permease [Bacillota bacterium]